MKICHVTTAHPTFDTRIFQRECTSLAQAGFDVSLVCGHEQEETINGVNIVPLPRITSKSMRRLWLTRVAARRAMEVRADLYHFHDPELIPCMRKLARRTKVPVIWDAHEDFVTSIRHFNQLGADWLSVLGSRAFDRMELRACTRDFAGVVTITDTMAERYRSRGVRTCVLGNFADLDRIAFPPSVQRSEWPRFTSSGVQSHERMVTEIAEAFSLVNQKLPCEVAFWGSFHPSRLRDELIDRACARGALPSRVHTGGPYAWNTLVTELLPTGWCGCVLMQTANRNNCIGVPNRCFENWANGVPVLATEGTEVARLVRERNAGLVIPDNSPTQIARAFEQFANDADLVREMGQAGRKAVEETYNWQRAFEGLLDFYKELGITPSGKSRATHWQPVLHRPLDNAA